MAETSSRQDPYVAFRFEVRLDGLAGGFFSECTGFSRETEIRDYPEGGLNTHVHKFPGRAKQSNLVLKRGIVDRELWDWYAAQTQGAVKRRNGSILVRDPSGGDVVMEWHFYNSFPAKWTGPELNAAQNTIAIETLELCHDGLERTK